MSDYKNFVDRMGSFDMDIPTEGPKKPLQHEYSDDDALFHYGVLGMKWGVRKDRKPQGFQYGKQGNTRAAKKAARKAAAEARKNPPLSEDYINSRTLAAKSVKSLSNKEIEAVNQRARLEKQFTELTGKGESGVQKALNVILKPQNRALAGVAITAGMTALAASGAMTQTETKIHDALGAWGPAAIQALFNRGGKKK